MRGQASHIVIARIYDADDGSPAARLLVDRLWPRGISRRTHGLDAWIPEVAPSASLRQLFNHEPAKWSAFRKSYRAELRENPAAVEDCLVWCRKGPVRLLYAARDRKHNHAIVLQQHLQAKMKVDGRQP